MKFKVDRIIYDLKKVVRTGVWLSGILFIIYGILSSNPGFISFGIYLFLGVLFIIFESESRRWLRIVLNRWIRFD